MFSVQIVPFTVFLRSLIALMEELLFADEGGEGEGEVGVDGDQHLGAVEGITTTRCHGAPHLQRLSTKQQSY